jgi:hypothetical protein
MASYQPLVNFTNNIVYSPGYTYVCESQRPCVYLYPSNSQGGHLKLPFFYDKEWMNITSNTDTLNMGQIDLRTITNLMNANSIVGTSVNIQVFAWADSVELTAPTVKLSLQGDEYSMNGPISQPASAIAHATGLLSKLPVIGKYMTATSMISSAIGSVASLFGFTNVPVIDPVHAFTPHPLPHHASPEISTTIEKLTLDPKNELTIDPSSMGADLGDELLISKFVGRECLLTTFDWSSSNVVNDLLFNIGIFPGYQKNAAIYTGPTQSIVYTTPLYMISKLFAYWRGDITIRLKFIASQFHRGRVRISWDPVGDIANTVDSTTEVFTKIVDIAECSDVSITIPYMQPTAFLDSPMSLYNRFGTVPLTKNVFENGVLTVRCLTDLSAPTATSTVTVLVFVRGAENMEFACPRYPDLDKRLSPYAPQGETLNYDASEEDETYMALEPSCPPESLYLDYHGECIKSLRTLLRRFNILSVFVPSDTLVTTDFTANITSRFARQPRYPGYDPNGPDMAVSVRGLSDHRYNYVSWTPMTWLSGCFIASKGSINWRANVVSSEPISSFKMNRGNRTSGYQYLTTAAYIQYNGNPTLNTSKRNGIINNDNDVAGAAITNGRLLPSLTVAAPLYSKYKFVDNNFETRTLGDSTNDTNIDTMNFTVRWAPATSNAANPNAYNAFQVELYCAAGVDYNLVFFLNTPVLYLYSQTPPTVP